MSHRNPEEILKVLEDQALEDEIRDIAAMSDEQLGTALREAGADPKEVHAAALEFAVRATRVPDEQPSGGEARTSPAARAPRRWAIPARWSTGVAAAVAAGLAAVVSGGTTYAVARLDPGDKIRVTAPAPPTNKPAADRIRARGLDACSRAQWQECLDDLDAASTLDPEGDRDPHVQAARRTAEQALDREPPAPPIQSSFRHR